jgi:hypothetical protein|tara:strand:- start:6994 stop:7311 length:318 start_codon:yes stop_codon:yes gene_type:complete
MNINKVQKSVLKSLDTRGLHTTVSIANACGMTQSTVYRALKGDPKRMTTGLNKLCVYANINPKDFTDSPEQSETLMNALKQVWDGTEMHAKQLARLLIIANSCKL